MKRVVYSSPYVPAELIAAYGLEPSRISPGIPGAGAVQISKVILAEEQASEAESLLGTLIAIECPGQTVAEAHDLAVACGHLEAGADVLQLADDVDE